MGPNEGGAERTYVSSRENVSTLENRAAMAMRCVHFLGDAFHVNEFVSFKGTFRVHRQRIGFPSRTIHEVLLVPGGRFPRFFDLNGKDPGPILSHFARKIIVAIDDI